MLTPPVLGLVQERLDADCFFAVFAGGLGLKVEPLNKAWRSGKLRRPKKKN